MAITVAAIVVVAPPTTSNSIKPLMKIVDIVTDMSAASLSSKLPPLETKPPLCRWYYKNFCLHGSRCQFRHEHEK